MLTSHRTFSGAEEFTNNLKVLKRATIVGEVTGGGAHPVTGHRINDRFTIGVPFARAINPVTRLRWEGVGVEPDVKVSADDALTTAQSLAAKEIAGRRAGRSPNGTARRRIPAADGEDAELPEPLMRNECPRERDR